MLLLGIFLTYNLYVIPIQIYKNENCYDLMYSPYTNGYNVNDVAGLSLNIHEHLVRITSQEECDFIFELRSAQGLGENMQYWLCGTDEVIEGNCEWVISEDCNYEQMNNIPHDAYEPTNILLFGIGLLVLVGLIRKR